MNCAPRFLIFDCAVPYEPAIDAWFDTSCATPLGALARQWFGHLRRCGQGDVRELMHDGCPTACVGDVALGYVGVYRAHVNLGFFQGASLPDPAGLLQGEGRFMRHVKLRPDEAVDEAALAALVDAAYRDIVARPG